MYAWNWKGKSSAEKSIFHSDSALHTPIHKKWRYNTHLYTFAKFDVLWFCLFFYLFSIWKNYEKKPFDHEISTNWNGRLNAVGMNEYLSCWSWSAHEGGYTVSWATTWMNKFTWKYSLNPVWVFVSETGKWVSVST